MILKRFLTVAILLTATFVYAQKPVISAVTDIEDNPGDGLEMCRSLFDEYFLSELTTHAKVTTVDTATTIQSIADLQIKRGDQLTPDMIKKFCAHLKVDAICSIFMTRDSERKTQVSIVIYSRDGKKIGTVKGSMETVGDTDKVSSNLAAEAAQILRQLKGIHARRIKFDSNASGTMRTQKDVIMNQLPSKVTPIK